MVSFRFYLVSVTAIFLALAVGITVGATVIDKATVDLLHNQIRTANAQRRATEKTNALKQGTIDGLETFVTQAGPAFVQGRLTETPILIAAVHGNGDDEKAIDDLRDLLVTAGARVQGVVWFNAKLKLDKPEDATALDVALGLPPGSPPDVARRTALSRLAASWSGVEGISDPLPTLLTMQMAEFKPAAVKDAGTLNTDRTRFVVAAPTDPVIPDDQLAVPLVSELGRGTTNRVVAVEAGRDASADGKPALRELFTGPVRADASLSTRLSTVDDIDDIRGRIVTVYAVQNLAAGVLGHFGVGPHARDQFNLTPQP